MARTPKPDPSKSDLKEFLDTAERKLELRAAELARPWTKWGVIGAGCAVVIALFSWFGLPTIVQKKVEEKMTEAAIRDAALHAATNAIGAYVSNKLGPLTGDVDKLKERVDQETARLQQSQSNLVNLVAILDLSGKAKGGSLPAFREIQRLSSEKDFAESATAAGTEIGFFFETWALQPRTYGLRDQINQKPWITSVDEQVALLESKGSTAEERMAAASHLRYFRKKNSVEPLMRNLSQETNLYVICQSIMSVNELARMDFHIIDVEKALKWWSVAKTNVDFQSVYDELQKFGAKRTVYPEEKPERIIQWMSSVADREPDAIRARCIRGYYFAKSGDAKKSEEDFNFALTRDSNSPFVPFYRGLGQMDRGDFTNGIISLSKAAEQMPGYFLGAILYSMSEAQNRGLMGSQLGPLGTNLLMMATNYSATIQFPQKTTPH